MSFKISNVTKFKNNKLIFCLVKFVFMCSRNFVHLNLKRFTNKDFNLENFKIHSNPSSWDTKTPIPMRTFPHDYLTFIFPCFISFGVTSQFPSSQSHQISSLTIVSTKTPSHLTNFSVFILHNRQKHKIFMINYAFIKGFYHLTPSHLYLWPPHIVFLSLLHAIIVISSCWSALTWKYVYIPKIPQ